MIAGARTMAGALTALVIAGCTYAPPALHVTIANHVMSPDRTRAAFAILATRSRTATGLSAFPDGGVPLVLNEGAAVYICDTASLMLERVWQVDRPAEFRSGFGPWMGPWTGDGIYLNVSGYATTTTDPTAFHRHDYLIRPDGTIDAGVAPPPRGAATSEPARCAQAVRQAAEADPPFLPDTGG